MNKYIVTTTINAPTLATKRFANMKDWKLIVVGDLKTPHAWYQEMKDIIYLHPDYQREIYPELSEAIGWNKIQRRNIGFLHAHRLGAEVVATVDDDNIPYESWGQNLLVGRALPVDTYESANGFFDPLSVTNHSHLWHRGYPIQHVKSKNEVTYLGKMNRRVLVQADLWDGDPDIDSMQRITLGPLVKFSIQEPYSSVNIAPFNSQNTFIHRDVLPYYFMMPFVGRMDDIWASYILQNQFPNSVIYNKPTVYQKRNEQDLFRNLEHEIFGYRHTLNFLGDLNNLEKYLPKETLLAYNLYREQYGY
jgi:hypothetical protein